MQEERVDYETMRHWILLSCYRYCRHAAAPSFKMVHPNEDLAAAYDAFENSFDTPIEKLMFEVIMLILYAGRGSEQTVGFMMNRVKTILSENSLQTVILPATKAI